MRVFYLRPETSRYRSYVFAGDDTDAGRALGAIERFSHDGSLADWTPFEVEKDPDSKRRELPSLGYISPFAWAVVCHASTLSAIGGEGAPGFTFAPLVNDQMFLGLLVGQSGMVDESVSDYGSGYTRYGDLARVGFHPAELTPGVFFTLWRDLRPRWPRGLFYCDNEAVARPALLDLLLSRRLSGREVITIWDEATGPRSFDPYRSEPLKPGTSDGMFT